MIKIALMFLVYLFVSVWLCGCGEITNVDNTDATTDVHGSGGHDSMDAVSSSGTGGNNGSPGVGGNSTGTGGVGLPNNSPCGKNIDCVSGFCHPDLGICLTPPIRQPPGSSCTSDLSCVDWCNLDYNLCASARLANGACTRDIQCVSTICDMGRKVCL